MGGWEGDRYRQGTVGQATVGAVLVVALVVVGSTVVVAIGNQALSDTERRSDLERARQAMTLFDSQTAQVALSESDRQSVRFGRTAGSYRVDPTAGEISVINIDRDDDEEGDGDTDDVVWTADGYPTDATPAGDDDDDIEYILNATLGAVVYESGDRTVAYQGGGVWQRGPDGGATMVSPPEFHYRDQTLTLPVVQVTGEGAASGSARATVRRGAFLARPVYPDASRTFDVGDPDPFENPVQKGSVIVRIESDYARAWGSYFEARTEGKVSYPADGVVTVELISLGQIGEFDMPLEGGSVTVNGATGAHSVDRVNPGKEAFSIRLRPDDADSAKFANLQWSLYADEGDEEFEMHLKKAGGGGGCSGGSTTTAAHLTIYYSWNDGEDYHGWRTTSPIEAGCKNFDTSDAEEEIHLDVTFVDDSDADGVYDDDEGSDDVQLAYQDLSQSDLEHFKPNGDLSTSANGNLRDLDGHEDPPVGEWEPVSPDPAGPTTLAADQLVNHYFAELPEEFDLRVDDKGSDTTNEAASSGTFYNSGSDRYVTYLHVTTNEVEVEVEADG